jgi:hypothetical protein
MLREDKKITRYELESDLWNWDLMGDYWKNFFTFWIIPKSEFIQSFPKYLSHPSNTTEDVPPGAIKYHKKLVRSKWEKILRDQNIIVDDLSFSSDGTNNTGLEYFEDYHLQ